ncbi:class IV adenylate cyclase [Planctomycetes bacterium K23_9]|uniref:CYTH domain protein n=1 Tax=Stieleria marina TaxID=1930275 RepID=A0A517NLX0_9BACT|nr:CYTH domain protein [Planctomycetes bacterium K23_9]
MNNAIEVEQKYHVDEADVLQHRLVALGATEQPFQEHADTYFNHPCRDFAQTHEALRIRYSNGMPLITYKGTKLPGAVKARRELEWRLDPGDVDGSQMQTLLDLLGFRRVATVKKDRRSFLLAKNDHEFTVTIDHVHALGWFSEIELVIESHNDQQVSQQETRIADARARILELAPELGLHRDEPRSYLRMLLESPSN